MKKRILSVAAAAVLATTLSTVILAPKAEAATPAPSTTPSVTRIWRGTSTGPSQCSTGYLCAYVPYNGGYYEFKFYYCGVYSLHYWHDPSALTTESFVYDDQTGNPRTVYYGSTGNVLLNMITEPGLLQWVLQAQGGWNPVYSIRVC